MSPEFWTWAVYEKPPTEKWQYRSPQQWFRIMARWRYPGSTPIRLALANHFQGIRDLESVDQVSRLAFQHRGEDDDLTFVDRPGACFDFRQGHPRNIPSPALARGGKLILREVPDLTLLSHPASDDVEDRHVMLAELDVRPAFRSECSASITFGFAVQITPHVMNPINRFYLLSALVITILLGAISNLHAVVLTMQHEVIHPHAWIAQTQDLTGMFNDSAPLVRPQEPWYFAMWPENRFLRLLMFCGILAGIRFVWSSIFPSKAPSPTQGKPTVLPKTAGSPAAGVPVAGKWFYQADGKAFGPLDESALRQLRAAGVITAASNIRRADGANWIQYADVFGNG